MEQNTINAVLLPIALGVIMLGLGLALRVEDFLRVFVYPRVVVIALGCQMLVLPVVCLGIAHLFRLPPELAVGLMLLAASPGGTVANLFSHLARGDVALNITLTAVNSVLSLLTMPLIVSFSLEHFLGAARAIPLPFDKVVQVISVVLVPAVIGMIVRVRWSRLADRLDRPVRLLSAVFLAGVVVAAVIAERTRIGTAFLQVGPAALVFNLASMAIGYFVPRLARIGQRQSIAIGMEIGLHNGALAIAIAFNVLGSPVMAIPPAVYSLLMFFTAAAFGYAVAPRGRAELAPAPPAAAE
jgi:bile acid:Na+ symporter, BASS family